MLNMLQLHPAAQHGRRTGLPPGEIALICPVCGGRDSIAADCDLIRPCSGECAGIMIPDNGTPFNRMAVYDYMSVITGPLFGLTMVSLISPLDKIDKPYLKLPGGLYLMPLGDEFDYYDDSDDQSWDSSEAAFPI